jgi:hypothetical protein
MNAVDFSSDASFAREKQPCIRSLSKAMNELGIFLGCTQTISRWIPLVYAVERFTVRSLACEKYESKV